MIYTVHSQLALNIASLHLVTTFSSHNPSILLNLVISMSITSIYFILETKGDTLLDFKGIIKNPTYFSHSGISFTIDLVSSHPT